LPLNLSRSQEREQFLCLLARKAAADVISARRRTLRKLFKQRHYSSYTKDNIEFERTGTSRKVTLQLRITTSSKQNQKSCGQSLIGIPLRDSALAPSLVSSTNAKSRPAHGIGRWERSTVWGVLRNPAYCGRACFGKTERRERQRITRRVRQRAGPPPRQSASHDQSKPLLWPKSNCKRTSNLLAAAPSGPLCKACWCASSVAMRSLDLLEEENITNSTTTAVLAPIAGDTSTVLSVRTGRFGKTILTH
jgi:hypothetical protein